jgi:hypothetical protein
MSSTLPNYKLLFLTLYLVLLSACAQVPQRKMLVECEFPAMAAPAGPALVAREYGKNSPIPLNAIQFTSPSLMNSLVVQMLTASHTATNTAQIYARVINCTEQPLKLGIRTSFLNGKQVPVEPVSAWKTVWVQALTTGNYTENSISRDVNYYLVEVRDDTQRDDTKQ